MDHAAVFIEDVFIVHWRILFVDTGVDECHCNGRGKCARHRTQTNKTLAELSQGKFAPMRRTQIGDYAKIDKAEDMEKLVRDKRVAKRANKKKANRRNRHYEKTLLKHLTDERGQRED